MTAAPPGGDLGVDLGVDLVRRLLERQFPELADRTLTPWEWGATDNAVFRLGPDLLVRLPRHGDAAVRLDRKLRWLPSIGRQVAVRVPEVVGAGRPDLGFGHRWSVQRWLDGRDATASAPIEDPVVADTLARFVCDLRRMDPTSGPVPGPSKAFRGVPSAALDDRVRWGAAVTTELGERHAFTRGVDVDGVLGIWQEAREAPAWVGPPTWLHGDLLPGNVVLRDGAPAAVIDFGCIGSVTRPATVSPPGRLFRGAARGRFLAATYVDDATAVRARGWAACVGITAAPYHHQSNPAFGTFARTVLDDLLASR